MKSSLPKIALRIDESRQEGFVWVLMQPSGGDRGAWTELCRSDAAYPRTRDALAAGAKALQQRIDGAAEESGKTQEPKEPEEPEEPGRAPSGRKANFGFGPVR